MPTLIGLEARIKKFPTRPIKGCNECHQLAQVGVEVRAIRLRALGRFAAQARFECECAKPGAGTNDAPTVGFGDVGSYSCLSLHIRTYDSGLTRHPLAPMFVLMRRCPLVQNGEHVINYQLVGYRTNDGSSGAGYPSRLYYLSQHGGPYNRLLL